MTPVVRAMTEELGDWVVATVEPVVGVKTGAGVGTEGPTLYWVVSLTGACPGAYRGPKRT